ncbi:MAG: OstA family protein, partial [Chitinophagaceae bacterium]
INGYFIDGNIDYMRAKGSPAESIYYMQDEENKFIGVNQSSADAYDIRFENKKPMRISGINGLKGTVFPMRQVNHIAIRLKGFQWLENLRPKSKYDLFGE